MILNQASRQWAERPADERCWNLQEFHERAARYKSEACEADVCLSDMRVISDSSNGTDQMVLVGKEGKPATIGHFAFGQLTKMIGAPTLYLRTLPAKIVQACFAVGMSNANEELREEKSLLLNKNGGLALRAITSDRYKRIWNADVTSRMLELPESGWRVPPARPSSSSVCARPATEEDCLKNRMAGLGIKPGDMIAPAGLYISEKDMFGFLVNEDRPINAGSDKPLFRGFFIQNSEVGDASFSITTFLYNSVCGNHIVWDAEGVSQTRIIHTGSADHKAWRTLKVEIKKYADDSASDMEAKIKKARTYLIADDKDKVLDFLFKKKITSRRNLEQAYRLCEDHPEDGAKDPRTAWGMVQGLTRLSQESSYADTRVDLDRAAGQVLKIAF